MLWYPENSRKYLVQLFQLILSLFRAEKWRSNGHRSECAIYGTITSGNLNLSVASFLHEVKIYYSPCGFLNISFEVSPENLRVHQVNTENWYFCSLLRNCIAYKLTRQIQDTPWFLQDRPVAYQTEFYSSLALIIVNISKCFRWRRRLSPPTSVEWPWMTFNRSHYLQPLSWFFVIVQINC